MAVCWLQWSPPSRGGRSQRQTSRRIACGCWPPASLGAYAPASRDPPGLMRHSLSRSRATGWPPCLHWGLWSLLSRQGCCQLRQPSASALTAALRPQVGAISQAEQLCMRLNTKKVAPGLDCKKAALLLALSGQHCTSRCGVLISQAGLGSLCLAVDEVPCKSSSLRLKSFCVICVSSLQVIWADLPQSHNCHYKPNQSWQQATDPANC